MLKIRTVTTLKRERDEIAASIRFYAQEASWRDDNRPAWNGDQVDRLARLVMKNKPVSGFQWLPAATCIHVNDAISRVVKSITTTAVN
jgi:hypothetical protein